MTTFSYRIGGFVLGSNIPLPELVEADRAEVIDCRFFLLSSIDDGPYNWKPLLTLGDGTPWLSVYKEGSRYHLQVFDLARFIVSEDGRHIEGCAEQWVPMATTRHLFLDQVLPLALGLLGRLAFHAGAVATPAGVVGFLGRSGQGKSTLTAGFCEAGYDMLTDDCLVIDDADTHYHAWPAYPGIRLWPDALAMIAGSFREDAVEVAHYTPKKRLETIDHFHHGALPLRKFYVLDRPDEGDDTIRISPLSQPEILMALVRNIYRLDPEDHRQISNEFQRLAAMATRVPVARLSYPRLRERLPDVVQVILNDVEAG